MMASVEIVSLLVDPDSLLVERDIMSNKEFVELVECSEISVEYQRLVEFC